jgi:hypothetical protein
LRRQRLGGERQAAPAHEFISGQLEPGPLLPGKYNDQGLAVQSARRLKKGQLQLQDKGFFDCQSWREVQAAEAFLVMPWTRSVSVWLPRQVELIFRQCKDTLRLDQDRSDNPCRVPWSPANPRSAPNSFSSGEACSRSHAKAGKNPGRTPMIGSWILGSNPKVP